jgi:hypothetical protein
MHCPPTLRATRPRLCRPSVFVCHPPLPVSRTPRSQGRLIGSDSVVRLENGTDSLPPPRLPSWPRSIHLSRTVPLMSSVPSLSSIWMLHVFRLYVAKVVWCCICCNCYKHILQVYVSNVSAVSDVCCKCFIRILHMLQAYVPNVSLVLYVCCKCFISMLHMLQAYVPTVSTIARVYSKCYSKCFMLQVFLLAGMGSGRK